MTNSSPWKDPPFLRTVNHLFLWAINKPWLCNSHNQRVKHTTSQQPWYHGCQGSSNGDSKRRCVRWLQRHRADVVGGSQAPRFKFGTQGELINGTSIWDSHGNLSIKHRVNPLDGMVLAWYPLASEKNHHAFYVKSTRFDEGWKPQTALLKKTQMH